MPPLAFGPPARYPQLTITPAALTVKTASAKKTYDGKALTKTDGYSLEGLQNGETVTVKVTGSQTTVGVSANSCTLIWDGTAKESNYEIKMQLGTLEVVSVPLTGDRNDLRFWLILGALPLGGTVLTLTRLRRRDEQT